MNVTLDAETEDVLRDALARVADMHVAPPGLHARVSSLPSRAHSTRPVVAAGLAGAAALTGVGLLVAGGRAGPGLTPTGPAQATHLTNAQLTAEVTEAVDATAGDIFEIHTTGGSQPGSSTHWLSADGSTLRVVAYAADGSPVEDESFVTSGTTSKVTDVDYSTKTWWTTTTAAPPGPPANCTQPTCYDQANGGMPPGGLLDGAPTSAAGVAWLLGQGGFTKTGQTSTIDGVANAFEIVSPSKVVSGVFLGNISMWIDPTTNLPVQVAIGATGSGQGGPAAQGLITSDVTWLDPGVAANAAQLQTTAPAGFSEVTVPANEFATPTNS
jgi:hypothetical protein